MTMPNGKGVGWREGREREGERRNSNCKYLCTIFLMFIEFLRLPSSFFPSFFRLCLFLCLLLSLFLLLLLPCLLRMRLATHTNCTAREKGRKRGSKREREWGTTKPRFACSCHAYSSPTATRKSLVISFRPNLALLPYSLLSSLQLPPPSTHNCCCNCFNFTVFRINFHWFSMHINRKNAAAAAAVGKIRLDFQ